MGYNINSKSKICPLAERCDIPPNRPDLFREVCWGNYDSCGFCTGKNPVPFGTLSREAIALRELDLYHKSFEGHDARVSESLHFG